MEKMCIQSYLKQGIEFDLYAYDKRLHDAEEWGWLRCPSWFSVFDAEEIAPESKIALFPWASIFSDYFRYALLAQKGGWWVDMDTICLHPFECGGENGFTEYAFARDNIDQYYISGFVMKAPANAPIMADAVKWIDGLSKEERDKLGHMDIGPYLLQKKVPEYGLSNFVAEPYTFDPIPWNRITDIVKPEMTETLEAAIKNSALIHLRQSIWNESVNSCAGILPDGTKLMTDKKYPENSLWEILKRRYM
jgi:hypothetical protein